LVTLDVKNAITHFMTGVSIAIALTPISHVAVNTLLTPKIQFHTPSLNKIFVKIYVVVVDVEYDDVLSDTLEVVSGVVSEVVDVVAPKVGAPVLGRRVGRIRHVGL